MDLRTVYVTSLVGYFDASRFHLKFDGTLEAAKKAISGAVGTRHGRGLRSGTFQAKIRGDRVRFSLFAPQTRSWYGPIFEGQLQSEVSETTLIGLFRMTFIEIVSTVLMQCGIIGWVIEYMIQSGYSVRISYWLKLPIVLCVISAVVVFPRLSWLARRWKMDAIRNILENEGFRNEVTQKDGCQHMKKVSLPIFY
jgi:hypothetical protein